MKKILLFFLLTIAVYPQWDFGFGTTGGGAGTGSSRFSAVDLDGSTEYMYRNYAVADSFLNLNGYERMQLPQSTMKVNFTLGNNGRDSLNTFTSSADTNNTVAPIPLRSWNSYATLGSSLVGGKFRITTKNGDVSGIQWYSAIVVGKVYYVKAKIRLVSGTASALYIGSSTDAGARFLVTPTTEEINYEGTFLALNTTLFMYSAGGANGEVIEFDDIEVREISNRVTDGTSFSTGWSGLTTDTTQSRVWASSYIRVTSATPGLLAANTGIGQGIGRRYVITYQITQYDSGSMRWLVSTTINAGATRSANGVYSDTLNQTTSTDNMLYLQVIGKFYGSIDNVHVYEIPSYRAVGNHSVGWSKVDALPNSASDTTSLRIISTGAGDATSDNAYIVSGSNTYHSMTSGNKYTLEAWVRATGARQTPQYDSDFSSADSATALNGWTSSNVTAKGNLDGIYGEDNVLGFVNTTGGASQRFVARVITADTMFYKIKVFIPTSNDTAIAVTFYNGSSIGVQTITTKGEWITLNGVQNFTTTIRFYSSTTGLNFSYAGGVDDTIYIKQVALVPIQSPQVTLHAQGQSKTTALVSVVPGTFTKLVFNFEANSTVADSIRIFVNQSDTLFVDSLNLTQSFDWVTYKWIRPNSTTTSILGAKLASLSNTARGRKISNISGTYYQVLQDNTYKDSVSFGSLGSFDWKFITSVIRHDSIITYVNGVQANKIVRTTGNNNNTSAFALGGLTGGSNYWNGLQGEIMMMRFDNISSSTFTSATPLSVYNSYTRGDGFLDNITSGGKRVVGWWDFTDGTTDALMLMDLSGNGYNLTGNNVTTSDRVNWKR